MAAANMKKRKNHNWCGIIFLAFYGLFTIYASFLLSSLNKGKVIGKLSDEALTGIKESFILWGIIMIIGAILLLIREYVLKSGQEEVKDTESGVSPHY